MMFKNTFISYAQFLMLFSRDPKINQFDNSGFIRFLKRYDRLKKKKEKLNNIVWVLFTYKHRT